MVIGCVLPDQPGRCTITDLETGRQRSEGCRRAAARRRTPSSTRSTRTRSASGRTPRWRSALAQDRSRVPHAGAGTGSGRDVRRRRRTAAVAAHHRGPRALQLHHPRRARLPEPHRSARRSSGTSSSTASPWSGCGRPREFLDALKDFGFRYATMGGISVGIEDLEVPDEKDEILARRRRAGDALPEGLRAAASSPTASATTRSSTPGPTRTTTWPTPWCATWSGRRTASTRCS